MSEKNVIFLVHSKKPELHWKQSEDSRTLNEIAQEFEVHPTQVRKWKE